MVKLQGLRRAALAALLLFSCLTVISPARAEAALTLSDIYSPLKILRVDLTLPQDSVNSLNNPDTYKVYVPASAILSGKGKSSGPLEIKVRLKGSTSLTGLNETPSFKFKFKKDAAGQGYLGLRRMTLNSMSQDSSKVHEFAAYALFNAVGVPASKTGWVRLYVNGVDRGLYSNIEQPDKVFMAKRFRDITQHIYEGVALQDLKPGNSNGAENSGSFLVDYGWKVTPNKNDLAKLIAVANYKNQANWYQNLNNLTDRSELIMAFAVEAFIGHWDSYSGPVINNYYLRSSTRGKFSYIPWGADQTFGENRATEVLGDNYYLPLLSERADQPWAKNQSRGKLYVDCIRYKPCQTEYLKDLQTVSAMTTKINLGSQMRAASKLIDPTLITQYANSAETLKLTRSEQTRSISFIAHRQAEVKTLLKNYGIK